MTDNTVVVAAMVIDNGIITFYKLDGTPLVITQGDPRGLSMYNQYVEQRQKGKDQITLHLEPEDPSASYLTSKKRNPLIKFFKAKIKDVLNIFGQDQVLDTEEAEASHQEAIKRVQAIAARLHKNPETSAADDELPVRLVEAQEPLKEDETIIAVTDQGIVPGIENLSDQFAAGEEDSAPAEGPDNLIMRVAAFSAQRGHTGNELMHFVKGIDLPILLDGSYLAYKRLLHIGNGVYVDPHSKKVHQRIGDIVQMDESLVDKSRRKACSQGLHIGTRHYMGGFHSTNPDSGTMLVLVMPEDTIAVPLNERSKARVMRYLLLADLSNKAHNLVNEGKRMDDCHDTMGVVAQIVAGARPQMLGVVNIGGAGGTKLTYTINGQEYPTNISLEEAKKLSTSSPVQPTSVVKKVRTIDDEAQGNQANLTPKKVRSDKHKVKPKDAVKKAPPVKAKAKAATGVPAPVEGQTRQDRARALWDVVMNSKDNNHRKEAAQQLRAFKRKAKVSWTSLGLGSYNVDGVLKKLLD